jgi:hypothetical protein
MQLVPLYNTACVAAMLAGGEKDLVNAKDGDGWTAGTSCI